MIFRVVTEVEQMTILSHVTVDVLSLDVIQKRICIREAELGVAAILVLDISIMEIIHQDLGEVKNRESNENRLVQLNCSLETLSCH